MTRVVEYWRIFKNLQHIKATFSVIVLKCHFLIRLIWIILVC